ncbi:L,D-transpeptidase family protein [Nitrosomonadales bacterium]|nr:L,D-transpeptidase family protein [Nitrosomonadales bacterium]
MINLRNLFFICPFLAALILFCSSSLGFQENDSKEPDNFYDKKPSVQRQILVDEYKKVFLYLEKKSENFIFEFKELLSIIKSNAKKTSDSIPEQLPIFQKLTSKIENILKIKVEPTTLKPVEIETIDLLPIQSPKFQEFLENIIVILKIKVEPTPLKLFEIKTVEPLLSQQVEIKTVESLLIKSLEFISNGQLDKAINSIDELIELVPNFKLAHLIRGDILTAYSMSINNFGGNAIEINSQKVTQLKKEAKRRIKGYLLAHKDNGLPKFNIIPDKNDKYLIYVDMDSSRLFVFEKKENRYLYLSDYYASIGKNGYGKRYEGDKKTPFGTYFLQKKIQQELTDFYGEGAYPLNYPNEFDKVKKYTGYGIWIHGTPKTTYSRPPEASDGCIVLSNKDLSSIEKILNTPGTPVILSNLSINELSLRSRDNIKKDQDELLKTIKKWKTSWAKKNYDEYMKFYSPNAKYNKKEYETWSEDKKRIFKNSKDIQISLNDISLYEYPSKTKPLRIVLFKQNYSSNLFSNESKKTQMWEKNNGQWKIIYEGTYKY